MGADKALIELDGGSLLRRAIGLLEPLSDAVLLACGSEPRYQDLGHPLALDRERGIGPLAGLAAGLEVATTEWCLAVACDMPRIGRGLLESLLERAHTEDLDICLSRGERGLEPLCAVYRQTCLDPIHAAIAGGQRRMVSFWRGSWAAERPPMRTGVIDLRRGGDSIDMTINLNSPRDLEEERRYRAEMGR